MSKPSNGLENLSDQFIQATALSLVESDEDKVVDGKNILARAAGQFFIVEGKSNNNRFYSKKLWENAIDKTKDVLEAGQMLGTIGHDQPIDDTALLNGMISHRVSKLWIDEKNKLPDGSFPGMGEILVLNTKSGQQLNAYLRGGVRFPVSSRAFGKFIGKGPDGNTPKIDEESYRLEGFDFVRIQGVPGAVPELVESASVEDLPNIKEEILMEPKNSEVTGKLLEDLTKQKTQLETNLTEALDANEGLKGKVAVLASKNEDLAAQLDEYKKQGTPVDVSKKLIELQDLQKQVESLTTQVESLKAFEGFGTPDEIKKKLEEANTLQESLNVLGSTDEIHEALTKALEYIKPYKDLGTVDEITEAFDKMDVFSAEVKSIGTMEEITESMSALEEYTQLGTIEEIKRVFDVMETYMAFGSPSEIDEAFKVSEAVVAKLEESKNKLEVKSVAESLKISESLAGEMLSKLGKDGTTDLLSKVQKELGESVADRFRISESGDVEPDENRTSVLKGSRASRLSEKFGK